MNLKKEICKMKKENTTRYPSEFKRQIVQSYKSGSRITDLSSEYGIPHATIHYWIKTMSENKKEVSMIPDYNEYYMELRNRIVELEIENEILKKVAAMYLRDTKLAGSRSIFA